MRTEPVVLVHGWGGSFERTWAEVGWDALLHDAGRRVIPVDLPGHGKADKPHDPEAYADLAGALAALLPDEPVDAVGFSLGAATLLELACRAPDRFGRLVVAGVGESLFREGDAERLALAVEGHADPEDVHAQVFATYAGEPGQDRAALAACLRRRGAPLTAERLAAVRLPVLVALGDRDFAGPADALVAALPDATFLSLPGCDHFATPKDFRFLDGALEFLDAVPA